jgi:hypothetical protein
MTDISVASTSYQVEKRAWLLSPHGTDPGTTPTITLDVSAFTAATHYPNGYLLSGIVLGRITATGLYAPYCRRELGRHRTAAGSCSRRSRSRTRGPHHRRGRTPCSCTASSRRPSCRSRTRRPVAASSTPNRHRLKLIHFSTVTP